MPYNPCCCWNLRDGCMVTGIWTTIYAVIQLCVFGWQTQVVKDLKDKSSNYRLTQYGSYDQYSQHFPGYYERFFETDRERFFLALFIIQIIKIIVDFTVLCAGLALIYGIQTKNKHLVWPWIPCMAVSILFSFGYCVMWWSSNVNSYWMILSICMFLFIPINIYCLLCVSEYLRQMVKGHINSSYYPTEKPKRIIVTDSDGSGLPESRVFYQDDINYGYEERRVVQPPYRPAYEEKHLIGPVFVEKETLINGSQGSTLEEIPPVPQFDEMIQTSIPPPSYAESVQRGFIETTFDAIGQTEEPQNLEVQQVSPQIDQLQRYLESMEEVQPEILVPTEIEVGKTEKKKEATEVSDRKKHSKKKSKSKAEELDVETTVVSEKRRHHSVGERTERSRKARSHRHRSDSSSSDSSPTRSRKAEKVRKTKTHDKSKSDGKSDVSRSSKRRNRSGDDLKSKWKEEKKVERPTTDRQLPILPIDSDTPSLEQPKVPRRDLTHYYPSPQYSYPPGAICIPQQFTVPTAQFSGPKPTKLQISSEITVTYSNDPGHTRPSQLPFYSTYQERSRPRIQTLPDGSSPDVIEAVHSNSEDSGKMGTTKI